MSAIDWGQVIEFFSYQADRPLLFNSLRFLVMFLTAYGIFLLLRRRVAARTLFLLAFSLYFYYLSSGMYFWLLLLSTLVNFLLGHALYLARGKPAARYGWLALSLAYNLGMLAYFKYTNFFIGVVNDVSGSAWDFHRIFLPVGISFYTFQVLSYTIDVYREKLVPLSAGLQTWREWWRALLDFAFFVSFFPQLVAGPIVRAAEFLPQIRRPLVLDQQQMSHAFLLIIGGLFKKAVISDYISINFVDRVFENPALYTGAENLLAAYGYAVQIYCDFSGYSDMAIGLALLMGFQLPINFLAPYQAISIRDFWRRWHISLSTWLRDYLYIGLGGNRRGRIRTYFNLMLTMLLGGLWHGASWVFVIWGGLHGLALALDRALETARRWTLPPLFRAAVIWLIVQLIIQAILWWRLQSDAISALQFDQMSVSNGLLALLWVALILVAWLIDRIFRTTFGHKPASRIVSVILIFHFVTLCWVFFRSGSTAPPLSPLEITYQVLGQIGNNLHPELFPDIWQAYPLVVSLIALGFLLHYLPAQWERAGEQFFSRLPVPGQALILALVIWLVIQTASSDVVPFIYFQF